MKLIKPVGPIPSKIMLVGECPNTEEIAVGIGFTGYSYQEIQEPPSGN